MWVNVDPVKLKLVVDVLGWIKYWRGSAHHTLLSAFQQFTSNPKAEMVPASMLPSDDFLKSADGDLLIIYPDASMQVYVTEGTNQISVFSRVTGEVMVLDSSLYPSV
jgi:hypothetical protein